MAYAPVFLGSDLGVYSFARQFNEQRAVTSHTVAGLPRGFINDSRIIAPTFIGASATDQDYVSALLPLGAAARERGQEPLLIASSDSQVDFVVAHAAQLGEVFTLVVPPAAAVAAVRNKAALAPLAAAHGLATPREVTIGAEWDAIEPDFPAPYILKPATSGEWEHVSFPGKLKVYVCASVGEAAAQVSAARQAGFTGDFLLQELVPGDDTYNYVTTVYVDGSGRVTLSATARMLLAIHTPNLLGNQALGLVHWYPWLATAVAELLQSIDYRGFATADVKVHQDTGVPYLLDINPRIGRSNYFLPVGGVDPVAAVVADIAGDAATPQITHQDGVFRIVPWALLRRYVTDPGLRATATKVARGRLVHPLINPVDYSVRRRAFVWAASANHVRHLARVYPRPTRTGF